MSFDWRWVWFFETSTFRITWILTLKKFLFKSEIDFHSNVHWTKFQNACGIPTKSKESTGNRQSSEVTKKPSRSVKFLNTIKKISWVISTWLVRHFFYSNNKPKFPGISREISKRTTQIPIILLNFFFVVKN